MSTNLIAEVRIPREISSFLIKESPKEQKEWIDDLVKRIIWSKNINTAVCILDSGVTRTHPLIEHSLNKKDHLAAKASWKPDDVRPDWKGHGTRMTGLTLYGDLNYLIATHEKIELSHLIESVKILPDRGKNRRRLYGSITSDAVEKVENNEPDRNRVFCLAVTEENKKKNRYVGRPTSWSAKIDNLAFNDGENTRLFLISAGNIRSLYKKDEYLAINDLSSIESPAQAWNALTVGAMTNYWEFDDPFFKGWKALAPQGDLNPCSRTSVLFEDDWPLKPDVVFEGGNLVYDPNTDNTDYIADLELLTTYNKPLNQLFVTAGQTSAAVALVSKMSASIYIKYPDIWPETIRALIVHSARWSRKMFKNLNSNRKKDRVLLLKRYGFGVPSTDRATKSANNKVTMIVENSRFTPLIKENSGIRTGDLYLHEFPWPRKELENLGEKNTQLRVTLSYFIKPNPGERGWTRKHKYHSFGLRFEVKRAEEDLEEFQRRINKIDRDNFGEPDIKTDDQNWYFGANNRKKGSLHCDYWEGSAIELSKRDAIAILPIGGWWKSKTKLASFKPIRYSLIVSLEVEEDFDIYTPILNEIKSDVLV